MEVSSQPHVPFALAPAEAQGGPGTVLHILEERKIPCFCGVRTPDRPARSPVSVTLLGSDERIAVKCIVIKWFVKVETGFSCFRYGPTTAYCEHGNVNL